MRYFTAGLGLCALLCGCAQAGLPAPKAIEDSEPDVTQQVSQIAGRVAQATLARDELTANAQAAMPNEKMQALAAALKPCGVAPALELLQRTTKGEDRQYVYRVPCAGKNLALEIDFNKGGKINRLSVHPN